MLNSPPDPDDDSLPDALPESLSRSEFVGLKNYKKLNLISRGGMGEVYLAKDMRLNRTVAIKIINTNHCDSDGSLQSELENTLTEARLLARLNHPNIVQLYDIEKEGNQVALIMENLVGKTLHQYQQEHIIPLTQKLKIITEISAGLAAAHAKGVIHCDLKPANIIISDNNNVKIVDFGIARLTENNSEAQAETNTSAISSTQTQNKNKNKNKNKNTSNKNQPPLYGSIHSMSPEQIHLAAHHLSHDSKHDLTKNRTEIQTIDFRSDLYSLGLIAFHLLAGYHPFSSTNTQKNILNRSDINANIKATAQATAQTQAIANANDIIPKLPTELCSLLNKLLAYDRENRPDSSQWVYHQFQQITKVLTQQEALAQDTQELSSDMLLKQVSANKRIKNQVKKRPIKKIMFSAVALCFIGFIATQLFWLTSKNNEVRYVAVLPLSYTSQATQGIATTQIAPMQKELISLSIYDAIKQNIINNKQLKLIPASELAELNELSELSELSERETNNGSTKGNVKDRTKERTKIPFNKIGEVTGATDIITTQLNCSNIKCDVVISHLVKSADNNRSRDKNWYVKTQQHWPTLLENFSSIYQTTQTHLAAFFPEYTSTFLTEKSIDEQDYVAYANIYTKIAIQHQINDENLQTLADIINRSPYLYSAYTLYRETSLDLYDTTRDTAYITQLQQIIQAAPPDYKYSIFQAIDNIAIATALGEYKAAVQQLALMKERGIDASSYIEMSAYLASFKGDWKQTIKLYRQAIKLRPSTKLFYNLALSYYQMGDIPNAIASLSKVLNTLPEQYLANQLIADIYLLTGSINLAITHYKIILAINVHSVDLSNLALALFFAGQHKEAMITAQKAVDLTPDYPALRLNLADIQKVAGLTQEANENYQMIINENNTNKDLTSQLYLAQAQAHLGNFDSAIKTINHAIKIATSNTQVAYIAALVYSIVGENTSAIIQVEAAISNNISGVWFDFPWFDSLCQQDKFINLMTNIGKNTRCQLHLIKTNNLEYD